MKKKDIYWMNKEGKEEEDSKPATQLNEKVRPSFIEIVENRIYFYADINEEKILQLNRHLRNKGIDLQREAMVQEREPANIFLHIHSYGGRSLRWAGWNGRDH